MEQESQPFGAMESGATLGIVEALAEVAATDTEYRDFYLSRARTLLTPVMSPAAFATHQDATRRISGTREDIRRALEVGGWSRVREAARSLIDLEAQRTKHQREAAVADRIYRPPEAIGPTALQAYAVSPLPRGRLADCQKRAVLLLQELAATDAQFREFYRQREAAVSAVPIADAARFEGTDPLFLQAEAADALARGQWERLATAAGALIGARQPSEAGCGCGPSITGSPVLDEEIPTGPAAERYGLATIALEGREDLRAYVSCRCAEVPALMDRPLTDDTLDLLHAACACHERCPALEETLRANVELLKHRAFITSLGTRYLPCMVSERVLVETAPEDPTAPAGPLLERLHLPLRVGLCREEIEQALVHAAPVLEEAGLDPFVYALVLIPFDVYLRASRQFGWGRQVLWTHFDGYQVLQGWRLRALVGGHARYGGLHDLAAIGRTDRRDNVISRLAVVRRCRMENAFGRSRSSPDGLTRGDDGSARERRGT